MISGHTSHQIGLDVDIWFTPAPDHELSQEEREFNLALSMVSEDRLDVDPKAWTHAHTEVVRVAAEDPVVSRIFVQLGKVHASAAPRRGGHERHFPTLIRPPASFCPDHGSQSQVRGLDDRDETRQCYFKGGADERRFGRRLRSMTATSIGRIAVSSLVLVAAFVATLVFGTPQVWREQPVDTGAAPAAPADHARRAAAMGSRRASIFHSLGRPVTRLSPAGLRQALLWNCCATASSMIEWSQITPDNSSWSLPDFLLGIMS